MWVKRSPELRDLSEEHHYGLVAARALRLAAAGEEPISTAVDVFLAEWTEGIQPHFRSEEEVLLPGFAEVAGMDHPLIVRTLAEHEELRLEVSRLSRADAETERLVAGRTAQLLHDHIRFEERVLFPAIEELLAGVPLQQLGASLKRSADERGPANPTCRALSSLPTRGPASRMQ
jgi:hemerythrin-like domain-containing protein